MTGHQQTTISCSSSLRLVLPLGLGFWFTLSAVLLVANVNPVHAEYTLEQMHIMFRHGNRTPEGPYPTDPNKDYSWPPTGWDQLSQAGIATTYRLGRYVRDKYNAFLGDIYYQQDVNATSTDIPRTKLSLEAFMAGLYPPKNPIQKWGSAGALGDSWQPFVYHVMPKHLDDFFYINNITCPRYDAEYAEVRKSNRTMSILASDAEMLREIKEKGGINTNLLAAVERFHTTVSIEMYHNLTVPSWTAPFWPERIKAIGLFHFIERCYTRSMQRVKAGPLVKHIIDKMHKARANVKQPRVWIYSGHDDTVSALALAVRSWGKLYPDFNAMIIIELLKDDATEDYAVQVQLRENQSAELRPWPIQGCESPCPLDKFYSLVKDVIPNDWRRECQMVGANLTSAASSSSTWTLAAVSTSLMIFMSSALSLNC